MTRFSVRLFLLVALLGGGAVFSWYGMRGYRAWKRRQAMNKPWVHKFQEPNQKLPKAPHFTVWGLSLGMSHFAQAKALTKKLGLRCRDNSIRGVMRRRRAERIAKLKAQGKVDGISGASWNRPSPRERNPMIRWNCDKVPTEKIRDIDRPIGVFGRLLFVFDSVRYPLRHLSYQYDASPAKAVLAFRRATEHYQKLLGMPPQAKDDRPIFSASSKPTNPSNTGVNSLKMIRKYDRFLREWRFAGIRVKLTLRSFGRWMNVSEIVEIPWPVRPDAPVLPQKK
ncbi:MAG: hypothetical protein H6727_05690 [Myxococcales bacterium]|nr:hypothetical protein [Myxococcales bacterium]